MARNLSVVWLLIGFILAGCSSVSIIPNPATPGAVVNPSDQSIKINNSGLVVSARVQDTAVGGYEIDTAIGAFYLVIANNSQTNVDVELANFHLVDSQGKQHEPLPPEEVNALLNPEIAYFLPYPFVGYYDTINLEQHRASVAMASERPYVGTGLPAIDQLIPLDVGTLVPGRTISGMLYFNIEIIDENRIELVADLPYGSKMKKLAFSFPFTIKK